MPPGASSLALAPAARRCAALSRVPDACCEQQRREPAEIHLGDAPHGVLVAVAGVELYRAAPDARPCVDVRARRDQALDNAIVSARDRPHQRGLLVRRFGGVDVGAARQQRVDHLVRTRPHRDHQRRFAARRRVIRPRASGQERRGDGRVSVLAGQSQRGHAVVVGGVRVGAGRDQAADQGEIVVVRSPVQRRRRRPAGVR